MFSCLWHLWDWLDPTSMENKKGAFQNNISSQPEAPFESIPKHQHNTAPQHLRLLQYGLKIPNNQHQHQLNSVNVHHHQSPYQRHSPGANPQQYNTPNIHANPIHQHYNNQYFIYQQAKAKQFYNTKPNTTLHTLNQQNAQVWSPPTINYQSKSETTNTSPTHSTQTPNKTQKEVAEKKKSNSNKQLRSPVAKRPADAPVTLQGWLHKQGSEGLMLWKKRWFVLTEYCLFYYKGSEEEKLLGSILLPSYKVSICGPEDKVNRKFAFKCEHTNMRTYILAADSQELMMQWIRVLNLACLLQTNIESEPSLVNSSSAYNQSNENSEQNARYTPVHMHSSSTTTDLSNPSQEVSHYNQPLYANAPPKPRRLNEGGYSSPSPDILDRYNNEPKYVTLQPMYIPRSMTKSPSIIYKNQEYIPQRPDQLLYSTQNTERRTPDTYGRSKTHSTKGRHFSDYEDIYAEQYVYKRPLSPLSYDIKKTANANIITPMQRTYTPVSMVGPRETQRMRKSSSRIPRPHSADFLEYEVRHNNKQPRPKSSLDINRSSNDNYFYSEERYAEKMRKSAQYLSILPKNAATVHEIHDNTFPLMKSSTQPAHYNNTPVEYARKEQQQPTRCRSVLSEGSLSKELDIDLRSTTPYQYQDYPMHNAIYDDRMREYDPFARSASARLASIEQRLQGDGRASMHREGEKKREESMKRLLEWKQRMLQSPLNRKINQSNNKFITRPEQYYKKPDSSNYGPKSIDPYVESPSANPFMQYNAYSSDDEENVDGIKESMQAGRTLDTVPTETAPFTSISVLPSHSDTPTKHKTLDNNKDNSEGTLTQPLKLHSKEAPHIAHVSCLKAEYSKKFEPSPEITEIKSNDALVKSILAEFEAKTKDESTPCTPVPSKDVDAIIEENYMTMTPKKNVFENDAIEENPYVEMTQGKNIVNILQPEQQPYEIVCFSEGHLEPLYMELHQPKSNKTLPDILIPPQILARKESKSDSSDADDEASKDLEFLDVPSHPRFSLSDTFRPASYYLGASQNIPELQDSSDSELVSPPPIPRSPPPFEELDEESTKSTKQNMKQNTSPFFNSTTRKFLKSSTTSLLPTLGSFRDQDTFSVASTNTDSDIRISRLSQNSDSDIELLRKSNYENMLKRRPVSEDFCDELASLSEEKFHDYENLCIMGQIGEKTETLSLSNISVLSPLSAKSMCMEGNTSLPVEITGFTIQPKADSQAGNKDVPVLYFSAENNCALSQPLSTAPYYYSDLTNATKVRNNTMLTLNNQRGTFTGKRDITHIINPIRCKSRLRNSHSSHQNLIEDSFKLASEARSVSVDFLNLADKLGQIDKKNIYESDTLKRLKSMDSVTSLQFNPEMKNIYPSNNTEKFNRNNTNIRRSYSLEGLLENALETTTQETCNLNLSDPARGSNTEGSYLWEEDAIWHERLRSASQRHTKSLDDLDCVGEMRTPKKSPRGITRGVTYVNDNIYNMPIQDKPSEDKGKIFIIDREKLRQWDLMSSAPSDTHTQTSLQDASSVRVNTDVDCNGVNRTSDPDSQEPASGSVSLKARDTFSSVMPTKQHWQYADSKSVSNINRSHNNDYSIYNQQQGYYMNRNNSSHDINAEQNKVNWNEKMNVSAGDLLGRTHEELVLLLIQLRRQSTNTCHAIEAFYNEIDNIQAQLHLMDAAKRMESLQKLEQIKQHLLELEKQYEKGKPLVNLVDNMVKLGSLYRSPNDRLNYNPYMLDRVEFNQQIQERKLLAEERRDWNRLNPNHVELQEKVQQLYQLDQLIQEESSTLQGLQHDKEEIERALGGLRRRLNQGLNDPAKVKQAKKQQAILENELSRVHLMLAQNSKKLEETVAGNARLEQELLVLKQKLQSSRQNRSSPQFSNAGDSFPCVVGTSAMLESDLQRVQQKVGDLQRQRQELSIQVKQLTDRSNNLQQQIKHSNSSQNTQALGNKKKMPSLWRETDLDTMNIIDHGESWDSSVSTTPLYINTDLKQSSEGDFYNRSLQSDSTSDDTNQILPQEKSEIKTVRIVKRESERRQRDREKTVPAGKWDPVAEEDDSSSSSLLFRPMPVKKTSEISPEIEKALPSPSIPDSDTLEKSPELSPVFKSEAAKQIVTEIAHQEQPKQLNRRAVPKEKRRHFTAPHNNLIMKSLNQLPTDDNAFDRMLMNTRRARDDLDMERALRQRIDAPDVVRSTLSNKELKYNESTIDNLLGTPNKISIPERYIPEQLPQLSAEEQEHRLRKVESIKKMLSDTTIISASTANLATDENNENTSSIANKATTKIIEEKKQREHLLQLNQILAKQVMEMSKIVAVKALAKLPLQQQQANSEDDDLSPVTQLPLYQQRDNFYS